MKFSSAVLAVVISTMMSTTEAVQLQADIWLHDPLEVTEANFAELSRGFYRRMPQEEEEAAPSRVFDRRLPQDAGKAEEATPSRDFGRSSVQDVDEVVEEILTEAEEAYEAEGKILMESEEAFKADKADEAVEADEAEEEPREEKQSEPRCFIDKVFASDSIQEKKNIQYGSNFNPSTWSNENLMLDAYLPPESD